jgi:tetratricopeptide (TPR) repeat protein
MIMKATVFFAVLLLSVTDVVSQSLSEAIYKTENERYADALLDFKALVAKEPTNGDVYFYYGDCYFEKGEVDSAIMVWNKGYEMDQLTPMPLVGKFRVLWLKGDKAGAQGEVLKAMELTKGKKTNVKRAEVIRGVAEMYIESETKDLDQALMLLQEAITKDPSNEDNYLLQGDALYAKTPQDATPAIKSYNLALDINKKSPRGKLRVANIYQAAQNYEEANKIYKEAIAIDSTFAPAYRARAEMFMRFEKMKLAIQDWKKYLALNNNIEARYRYANAMFAAKQYCEVIAEVNTINEAGVRNFYTERMLAGSYAECKDFKGGEQIGLDASDRFFAIVPAANINFIDYRTRGTLLMKLGKDSLGLLEWERAAGMNETASKELTLEIAKAYYKMKNYDKAIEMYLKRQAIVELTLAEVYNLGQCYYAGPKNFVEADTLFGKVASMSPNYAPAYLWRARSNYQMDLKNERWLAKPHYAKVLEVVLGDDRKKDTNKKMVIESARYMGNYYASSAEKDKTKVLEYFQIVYDLDPNDTQAKQILGIK